MPVVAVASSMSCSGVPVREPGSCTAMGSSTWTALRSLQLRRAGRHRRKHRGSLPTRERRERHRRMTPAGPTRSPRPRPSTAPAAECGGFLVVTPPDVTAADLASFRPARPSLTGEPTGFGIVGAPTNVVAAASEQYIAGTLLGWDVTVRFMPAGYVFDYGDGINGALRDRRRQLGGARSGAVHPDRHQPRLPRARDVSGERDGAVCGIRRLRQRHVAPRHGVCHGDDRRVRRAGRRGPHRPRRPDLPGEPRRSGLLSRPRVSPN